MSLPKEEEKHSTALEGAADLLWSTPALPSVDPPVNASLEELARQYVIWGLVESEAAKHREALQQSVAALPSPCAGPDASGREPVLPNRMPELVSGLVSLRTDRSPNEPAIVEAALAMLREAGHDQETALRFLEQPNLWHPPEFSSEGLLEAIRNNFGLDDPATDPRFAAAIVKPARHNTAVLLAMLEEWDPQHRQCDRTHLTTASNPRLVLSKKPASGPLRDLRDRAEGEIAATLAAPVEAVASRYIASATALRASDLDPSGTGAPRRASRKKSP